MLIKMSNKGLLNTFGHSVLMKIQNAIFGLGGYLFFTDKRALSGGAYNFYRKCLSPPFSQKRRKLEKIWIHHRKEHKEWVHNLYFSFF